MNWEHDTWGSRFLLLGMVVSAAVIVQAGAYIWDALH
jgi:hypothetical protein